jgi:hypothetical protein
MHMFVQPLHQPQCPVVQPASNHDADLDRQQHPQLEGVAMVPVGAEPQERGRSYGQTIWPQLQEQQQLLLYCITATQVELGGSIAPPPGPAAAGRCCHIDTPQLSDAYHMRCCCLTEGSSFLSGDHQLLQVGVAGGGTDADARRLGAIAQRLLQGCSAISCSRWGWQAVALTVA